MSCISLAGRDFSYSLQQDVSVVGAERSTEHPSSSCRPQSPPNPRSISDSIILSYAKGITSVFAVLREMPVVLPAFQTVPEDDRLKNPAHFRTRYCC